MNILKSFSIYFISTIVEKGIGFLILPILTGILMPESVGKLSLLTSIYAFLSPLIVLSTNGAIAIEYHKNEEKGSFSTYFTTALLINFTLFVFFSLCIILKLDWLTELIKCPPQWILALPVFCFFDAIKLSALSIFQISKKPIQYVSVSLLYTILNFCFSLLFVYKLGLDYEGRLSGIFLSGLLVSFFCLFLFIKKRFIDFRINKAQIKDVISYGLPLIPHAIGFLVLDLADRFFINKFSGQAELGIYSISYLVSSMLYVLAGAFTTAWIPHLYDDLKTNTHDANLKIVKTACIYAGGLLITALSFVLFTPLIYHIFISENYYSGIAYTPYIIMGYFFMGIYLIFAGIIFYEKKNYIFGFIAIFNIVVNLVLNYFLIQKLGAKGAAIATCISMFLFMLIIFIFSNRVRPLPWKEGILRFIKNK